MLGYPTVDLADRSSLTRFAWLSIVAALTTMAMKTVAYQLTGSVGLLSDAVESLVNLAGALMALSMLTIAARPADEDHAHGHSKAEYFSSGVEGTLILLAAASIAYAAVQRMVHPRELERLGAGLTVSVGASLVNLGVALVLLKAARKNKSITLEANARHLLTDVWTSVGVLAGVGAVALTGWQRLDPMVAIGVAVNIVWTGFRIVRESVIGLMDAAIPVEDQEAIHRALKAFVTKGVQYHAMRTRRSGARQFVSLHVLVPGDWTVKRGHDLVEEIEGAIRGAVANADVVVHLEPLEDPKSWEDAGLSGAPKPKSGATTTRD